MYTVRISFHRQVESVGYTLDSIEFFKISD